jgi:hypothetical protein
MNVLVESEPEDYEADSDDSEVSEHKLQDTCGFNDDIDSEELDTKERRMEKALENNRGVERSL